MPDLSELIARVEGEGEKRPFDVSQDIGEYFKRPTQYQHPGSENPVHLNYCYSLDSALALVTRVLPGLYMWGVEFDDEPTDSPYRAWVCGKDCEGSESHSTAALALILALLRALAVKEKDRGE